ncbi:NB-ARC domain-containing protein [Kribbella sp. CA-245084]|uniref:NB-ARC domain-containing protein n=1 Tax=Kribbella sp. CA-245084 TaxID=3239940 RepID=UPI003D89F14A
MAVAAAGLLMWWAQRSYERHLAQLVPATQRPEPWVIDRPVELSKIVQALRTRGPATVGITTAVHGAGGFGKTTIARLVRSDRRTLRRFGGRVYWVTLGRDARRGALVEKVNDLVRRVDPERGQPFTDVRQAAEHLAAVLAVGPRRLVILDDVWFSDQLEAFPVAGRCARLVTTRIHSLVSSEAIPIEVDQMSSQQARMVLTADLTMSPPPGVVDELLVEIGRWPLLLRLVNKIMVDQTKSSTDITTVSQDLLHQLRRYGMLQVDELTGAASQQLDISDPDQRNNAVAATIQASTGLLTRDEYARFSELAVFVEDETIPVSLTITLWRRTGRLSPAASRALCARLADLALLTLTPTSDGGVISLHDVVRDHLNDDLGAATVVRMQRMFIDALATELPLADSPEWGRATHEQVVAWWRLPHTARYLREHLVEHLLAADLRSEAETVAADLRWVASRLENSGPIGPYSDLARIDSPRCARLARLVRQIGHLLKATDPPRSLIDILYSRVSDDVDWGPQAALLGSMRKYPSLTNTWHLPDVPDPALRLSLSGHEGSVRAVAISSDGAWLVTAGSDRTLRIWDAATGELRNVLSGGEYEALALAISPDGRWLATADSDGGVRMWDATTGGHMWSLVGPEHEAFTVVISPDGDWLATAGRDGTVRIWDVSTGELRKRLSEHGGTLLSMAVSPDGTWLVTADSDETVQLWDTSTGERKNRLVGHRHRAFAMAISPDGTWLATGDSDEVVRTWDASTGELRRELGGHDRDVLLVAISPDGTWLASAGRDPTVRIWDAATGELKTQLTGHADRLLSMAVSPDGIWLAAAGADSIVRIWDSTAVDNRRLPTGREDALVALAVAPDGSWVAGSSLDSRLRIWDTADGQLRPSLAGHVGPAQALVVTPDGSWLAGAGFDLTIRLRRIGPSLLFPLLLTGHKGEVHAMAVSPDGTWLATAGSDPTVMIWNLDPDLRQIRRRLVGHKRSVFAVAVSPDGTRLATAGSDPMVVIWSVDTGAVERQLAGHRSDVLAVTASPDGSWLATADADGAVLIWEFATGMNRLRLNAHDGPIRAVAASPDSLLLATVGDDRTLRIWSLRSGTCLSMMRVEERLKACLWQPSASAVIVAGDGGLYRFQFELGTSV